MGGERKSHVKSRLGCVQCKARRVKCDEKHPSCSNCQRRREPCSYKHNTSTADSSPEPGSLEHINANGGLSPTHLKQLELMHQYSTSTYETLAMRPQGPWVQQVEIPQLALKHDFLLSAIFAITSLHFANLRPEEAQFRIADAVWYQSRALASCRSRLEELTAFECQALYYCSAKLGAIALAFRVVDPACAETSRPTDTLLQLSQLWRGTYLISRASRNLINSEMYQATFRQPTWTEPRRSTPPEVQSLLDLLRRKAHSATTPTRDSDVVEQEVDTPTPEPLSSVYLAAIDNVEMIFQVLDPESSRVLAWLIQVPATFVELLNAHDALACAISLLWCSNATVFDDKWWTKDFRHDLTKELSPVVLAADLELAQIVAWVAKQP